MGSHSTFVLCTALPLLSGFHVHLTLSQHGKEMCELVYGLVWYITSQAGMQDKILERSEVVSILNELQKH